MGRVMVDRGLTEQLQGTTTVTVEVVSGVVDSYLLKLAAKGVIMFD